jgi:putative SOS response-associated peptidase YedK
MCGRYTITSAPEAIRALFRYPEQPNFPPRYNIAPTQPIPIVRLDSSQVEARPGAKPVPTPAGRASGERHFALVRWGLIPGWVKDPKAFSLVINARGDSVLAKPAFRNAMRYRRCLVPADGFYEWQAAGTGPKRPFYIRASDGNPMAFAGLWEVWSGPNGEEVETAAIVTTDANRTLAPLHHRMPVIVPPEAFDMWLDCRNVDAETAAALIAPAPDGLLEAWPVSMAVNKHANDDASLIAPVGEAATQAQAQTQAAPHESEQATGAGSQATKPKRHKDDDQPSLF